MRRPPQDETVIADISPVLAGGRSLFRTGAVVAKIKSYPTHTSLGAGSFGALVLALQARDWIAAGVAAAGFVPPVAMFIWHVGLRNVLRHVLDGDPPEPRGATQA